MGPYRDLTSASWFEEELWQRLDHALVEALRDPGLAWAMAWSIAMDATAHPEVTSAAVGLMSATEG